MKKLFLTLIFIALFAAVSVIQVYYDQENLKSSFNEPLVMNANIVRAADLGLDNAASDIAWLSAIQYFGGAESPTFEKLNNYLTLSTDLDPHFAYPYAFGALILPSIGKVSDGVSLAKKGIDNGVQDWRIPYYLATTYYLNLKDLPAAAKYFDMSANTPGAPDNIKAVAASFGSNTSDRARTIQIWSAIYENSNDETIRERAKNYIVHLQILDFLDQASVQYKEKYGNYPTKIDDLVTGNILKAIPADPFGLTLSVDSNGKTGIK